MLLRFASFSVSIAGLCALLLLPGCPENDTPVQYGPVCADFQALQVTGQAPFKVYFQDLSTPLEEIDTWAWDFGNLDTAETPNPMHTFNIPGTYTISLTVSGPGGTDTLTRFHYIHVEPATTVPALTAQFTASPTSGSAPLTVQFTDLSTTTGSIDTWAWNFGDSSTATDQDPSHTYSLAGTYSVTLTVTSGTLTDIETKTGFVQVSAPPGPAPLVSGSLKSLGVPTGGLAVISDLEVFSGALWMMESKDPLADWGAKVYTYDGTNFSLKLSDSTSQGYLRGRVIGGKLYVPDADPNGYDPGIVYIWTSASTSPQSTSVTSSVHNFDVVSFNSALYTSGGLVNGMSGLNKLSANTWSVASQGSYSRLKYMAVFDNRIWATKRMGTSSVELVLIDSNMTQSGVDVLSGTEALCVDLSVMRNRLYMSLWGSAGVSHLYVEPTTWNVVNLTGITSDLLWDFCEHSDGNMYAVAMYGVYGSQDGKAFTKIISVTDNRFGQPGGSNADGRASIASYNGKLYVGSSTNGTLYVIQ
jgi:PKD repeat protein